MKKFLLLAALMMFAAPALSQDIGVYFDTEGTNLDLTYEAYTPGYGPYSQMEAYVIAYAEALVSGGAYTLDISPNLMLVGESFPPGIQVGTATTGVEIATTESFVGYYHVPVLLSTINMVFLTVGNMDTIQVLPHPRYETVMIAKDSGELIPATGFTSHLTPTVPNDHESWGSVKSLFQ